MKLEPPDPLVAGSSVTVFCVLGPNPAPLIELVWYLAESGVTVDGVHVVVDVDGMFFLEEEIRGGRDVWDELSHDLARRRGMSLPSADEMVVTFVQCDDDFEERDAVEYNDAVWSAARDAISAAGDEPVVFGLTAGRRRTMQAATVMAWQALARGQDCCVDVRVTVRAAEGGTGFFFPTQRHQFLRGTGVREGEPFLARQVGIRLAPVLAPRLGRLLAQELPDSFSEATRLIQAAVDGHVPPELEVDLIEGECRVDGEVMPVTGGYLVWYATLAAQRRRGAGEGWVETSGDDTELKAMIDVARGCPETWAPIHMKALRFLEGEAGLAYDHAKLGADLRRLRSRARRTVREWCEAHRPFALPWLEPERRKTGKGVGGDPRHEQRLRIPSGSIEVIGPLLSARRLP